MMRVAGAGKKGQRLDGGKWNGGGGRKMKAFIIKANQWNGCYGKNTSEGGAEEKEERGGVMEI